MSLLRLFSRARGRFSYSSVTATLALFVALGGGAYAAAVLPKGSVGRAQLRTHAVSADKLADRAVRTRTIARHAVRLSRLSVWVRRRLERRARRGPVGPKGDPGPRGAAGVAARRINYDAVAQAVAMPTTVLDVPGLKLAATCTTLSGGDVQVALSALAAEDATLQASFTIDSGSDPANPPPGSAQTANTQVTLIGGTATSMGGPGTSGGAGYVRVIATGIFAGASHTITLNLVEMANADTQRCRLAGTALPAA